MPRLLTPVALADLPLSDALHRVRAALDGSGDALLPVAADPATTATARALQAGTPLAGGEDDPADPTSLVMATSGSTGEPKGALLPASALHASATATHERLGGPGRWLLALPLQHVAGVQVLVRSIVAGTDPVAVDLHAGFDVTAFTETSEQMHHDASGRRYTALVPTQLVRLLGAGGAATAALSSFDAVLLGGAAASPALLQHAEDAGVRVVTTYGMSETCGGCVYDGTPLPGVRVAVDQSGRISLGGAVVARGYRLRPGARQFSQAQGVPWFTTEDVGTLRPDQQLTVLGRADDVINTGGVKVSPVAVESALADLPAVLECLVVGVPDAEWGQRVVALVVARPGADAGTDLALERVRQVVRDRLGPAAAPQGIHLVDSLPLKTLGKPDRSAATRMATALATSFSEG